MGPDPRMCCRIAPPSGFAPHAERLVQHVRLALGENCVTCLERYRPGGEALNGVKAPFVLDRITALGFLAEALRELRHGDSRVTGTVARWFCMAVDRWPGQGNGSDVDRSPSEPMLGGRLPEALTLAECATWFTDVGLPPDLVYLCCELLGVGPTPSGRSASFYLVEAECGYQIRDAWFDVAFVDRGRGAVLAHPARMLTVSVHSSFRASVEQAHAQAVREELLDPSCDVLWWARFEPGQRAPLLTDRSVGLAAGVAMARRLGDKEAPPPPGEWPFAGSTEAFRGDQLAEPEFLVRKHDQVRARPQGGLLIVPQKDLEEFVKIRGKVPGILGVGSLSEALTLASQPSARSPLLLPFSDPELDLHLVPEWALQQLEEAATEAAQGGAAAIVLGEPGIGKSAILHRLARELHRDGWVVVQHRCDAQRRGPPMFAPFRDLLCKLEKRLAREGDVANALQLRTLYADLDLRAPDEGTKEGRFRVRRESIGRRLFERVSSTLAAVAGNRRIALLVDDLHWADETSCELFLHLAGGVSAGGQLLLVGGLRPMAGEGPLHTGRLDETLGRLASGRFRAVDLGQLPADQEERLVRETLAACGDTDPDPRLVSLLQERAGPNPFSLKIIVNWLHETKKLWNDRGRWRLAPVNASDIPDVDAIIDWLLTTLPPRTHDALRHAAVIGREFRLDVLKQMMGRDDDVDDLAIRLDESQLVWVVPEEDKSQRLYEFVHARVVARLRDNLSQGSKRALHRKAAIVYESLADYEQVCHLLALHRKSAGQPDEAAPHFAWIAVRDRLLGAYDTALRDRERELHCRADHTPADPADRAAWRLAIVEAHIDRAGIYRLRGDPGDLDRAAQALVDAREALQAALGSSQPVAPERVLSQLPGDLGLLCLLHMAQAEAEAGDVAWLTGRLDQAQANLEAAMYWGERLRVLADKENHHLCGSAVRVLAKAGCSLMSLYMARAMRYLKLEPHHEEVRRGQERRVMFLCTRLLALIDHLSPTEKPELRVRVRRMQGNVFFWLEGHPRLARDYYDRTEAELRLEPVGVGAQAGDPDHDVYSVRARLRLSQADIEGAYEDIEQYRRWAEDVGAREHQAVADFTAALVEVVTATAAPHRKLRGSLDRAAQLLEAALAAPFATNPEHRLQSVLLRRFVAEHRDGEDPADWDAEVCRAMGDVWGGVPAELQHAPEALLFSEVFADVPWWVLDQIKGRQPTGALARLKDAVLERQACFSHCEPEDGQIDLADEMEVLVKARVSRGHFVDRVQPVAREAQRLCSVHLPGDERASRVLRCAAYVHDCLWEVSEPELERLVEEWQVTAEPLEHAHPQWLHGRLGFELVRRELKDRFEDEGFKEELRSAVEHHTWPGVGMPCSAQLFFLASSLVTLRAEVQHRHAELRGLDDSLPDTNLQREQLQRAAQTLERVEGLASAPGFLDLAVHAALEWVVARQREHGDAVHPRALELLNVAAPECG